MKYFTICMIVFLFFIGIVSAEEDINAIRKMALEPYEEYHLYRGDLHVHTNYSADAVSRVGGIGHTPHPRSFTVMDLQGHQIIVKHHRRDYWDYGCEISSIFPNAEVYPDGPLYQYDFVAHSFYFVKIRLKGFNEYGIPYTVFTSPVWVNNRSK